jgi:hypothetical protein
MRSIQIIHVISRQDCTIQKFNFCELIRCVVKPIFHRYRLFCVEVSEYSVIAALGKRDIPGSYAPSILLDPILTPKISGLSSIKHAHCREDNNLSEKSYIQ